MLHECGVLLFEARAEGITPVNDARTADAALLPAPVLAEHFAHAQRHFGIVAANVQTFATFIQTPWIFIGSKSNNNNNNNSLKYYKKHKQISNSSLVVFFWFVLVLFTYGWRTGKSDNSGWRCWLAILQGSRHRIGKLTWMRWIEGLVWARRTLAQLARVDVASSSSYLSYSALGLIYFCIMLLFLQKCCFSKFII